MTQRLEKAYSDNILGALQKEFDSYQAQSTSDWVAYDVEYVMGTAYPGDSLYVLHADNLNPFSQSDAYELYYIDTGETTELVNSKGFTSTVPVYQLVENTDAIIADQQAYSTNWSQCFVNLEKMKRLLGADGYADLQADAEQITGDISGAYYEEGAASGIYIDLSAADFSDPASAGSFHYLADGDGFDGAALYEVAANIYCTRTIENDTYIFGFSKQGSEVVMDFYSAGEHSSMMKREDGSEVSSNPDTGSTVDFSGTWLDSTGTYQVDISVAGDTYTIEATQKLSDSEWRQWSLEGYEEGNGIFYSGVYVDLWLREDGTVGGGAAANDAAGTIFTTADGVLHWASDTGELDGAIDLTKQ
ncbi:hypothetical protein H6C13_19825 [Pseudoflavonifractor phocaeensis]|nr:hypothetical protein [Pseudoflavonifractor phocaeensis]